MKVSDKRLNKRKLLKVFSISLIFVILIMTTVIFCIYYSVEINHNNINKTDGRILIYDSTGNQIDLPSLNTYVRYDDISNNIINAFIALEDKRFFQHKGIDYIRVFGALKNNIKHGYIKEGGSTITQQLAKNTQLNNKKTMQRKIREAKLASDLEKLYSKEEILEMYLNAIYFGNGIYGINQACWQFFNKKPCQIEIFEAAILAGIVKNPSRNSPLHHPENSRQRSHLVLRLMKEQGFINVDEFNESVTKEYVSIEKVSKQEYLTPYYNVVISQASKILGVSEKVLKGRGIKIETYLDRDTQNLAHKAFVSKEFQHKKDDTLTDYSILVLDNHTGGAKSYYASHNYCPYKLRRQPGSALKPILVYAPALEQNYITPASLYSDKKTNFGNYSPSNHLNNYQGTIDIRRAVIDSSNVIAVKVLEETGIDTSKNIASKMGINFDNEDKYLSLALGAMRRGVTSIELSQAYMCLANNGMQTEPVFIKCIRDMHDNILYQHVPFFRSAINANASYLMTDMLLETAKRGTAKKLSNLGFQVAAKTGTVGENTNKLNSDAWNLSYTKDNTICIWYGNLKNDKTNDFSVTGGTLPTLLARYMHQNTLNVPSNFDIPDGIIELNVDKIAIKELNKVMLATQNTPREYIKREVFNIANCPKEYSPFFIMPNTNLKIEYNENSMSKITFTTQPFFKYKIIKKNLATNSVRTIYTTEQNNGTISIYDSIDKDDTGIISYAVEVENKYCSMGICDEKYMILGLLPFDNTDDSDLSDSELEEFPHQEELPQ